MVTRLEMAERIREVALMEIELGTEETLKRLGRCENCGRKGNHRTDPLFGGGPPHFTCKSDEDVVGSQHEY